LHYAAARRDAPLDLVQALVDVDPTALEVSSNAGLHPLHVAAQHASPEVVRLLATRHPHALKERTVVGRLPLHVASQRSSLEVVRLSSRAWTPKPCKTAPTYAGWLPLELAALRNPSPDVAYFLAAAGPEELPSRSSSSSSSNSSNIGTWALGLALFSLAFCLLVF
jgi:ankyrin repeat protein